MVNFFVMQKNIGYWFGFFALSSTSRFSLFLLHLFVHITINFQALLFLPFINNPSRV